MHALIEVLFPSLQLTAELRREFVLSLSVRASPGPAQRADAARDLSLPSDIGREGEGEEE